MKLTIFGDSHVGVLRAGLSLIPEGTAVEFHATHGLNWRKPDILSGPDGELNFKANAAPNGKPLDLRLRPGGKFIFSSPLHTAPQVRRPLWKTHCPWEYYEQNPDLVPIPDSVLHSWVDHDLTPKLATLETLQRTGFDVAVIEAPRPLARTPARLKVPADLLRTVDRICRDHIFDALAKRGVPVIRVPQEAIEDGLTPEHFSSKNPDDPHHGNNAFGALLMKEILRHSGFPSA